MTQPEVPGNGSQPADVAAGGQDPWDTRARQRRGSRGLTVVALLAGLAGLIASVAGVAIALLPRQFTAGQQQQIMAWETSKRWRSWPAGKIFPPAIGYQIPADSLSASSGLELTAHRAGIGPQSACAAATDPASARVLRQYGCTALLRATYTDATGAFVTTVGVAVLSSSDASDVARDALIGQAAASTSPAPSPSSRPAGGGAGVKPGQGPGVRALPVGGTLAAAFRDPQRQVSSVVAAGPYLVMYTTGYTDGRPRAQLQPSQYAEGEMVSVSVGIASAIASRIGAPPPVPHCPGTPGC